LLGCGGAGGTGWGAYSDQGGGGWAAPVAVAENEQTGTLSALSRRVWRLGRCCGVRVKVQCLVSASVGPEAGAPDHGIECYLITGAPLDTGGGKATEHRGGCEKPCVTRMANGWGDDNITRSRDTNGIVRAVVDRGVAGGGAERGEHVV